MTMFDLNFLRELATSYTLFLIVAVIVLWRWNVRISRQKDELNERLIRILELKNAEDRAELHRQYPGAPPGPPN